MKFRSEAWHISRAFKRRHDRLAAESRAASALGFKNEQRVVAVLRAHGYDARLATKCEDADGIDVVVGSDAGPLWLQVKSSEAAAAQFKPKRQARRVVAMHVGSGETDAQVFERAADCLRRVRAMHDVGATNGR